MRHPRNSLQKTVQTFAPLLLAAGAILQACGSDSGSDRAAPAPPTGDYVPTNNLTCIDNDGDTFGASCVSGADCDDADPEVTDECRCEGDPKVGCGCEGAGEQAACGTVYSRVGDTVVCGQGVMSCDGDTWGECIINNAVTLKSMAGPSTRLLALGAPSECASNPCDPGCQSFTDTISDLTFDPAAGVITTPTGVTLPSTEGTVIPGISGSGFNCKDADYPADGGGCGHHPCLTGDALGEWCDGDAPYEIPLLILQDNFGSATGWTMGTNWAIGATSASSGQFSGNADPASDFTTGNSDNRIAGTVLGGDIGGTVTVLTENFANQNAWTESGEADWRTSNRTLATGYATGGSGNPVLHSDNCDSQCIIALTNGLNLSTYGTATVGFQWFLAEALDTPEYITLEAFNGSTWAPIFNKASENDDDGSWHPVSINLASSYLVNGFKLRFLTASNENTEQVEVDDLVVTAVLPSTTSYLTSPVFNTANSFGNVTLSFRRWLNVNADFVGKVEVYNGSTWIALYTSSGAVSENAWQDISHNITAHKSNATRVRFSYTGTSANKVSGWNIDDLLVMGTSQVPGTSLCINKVCTANPACCTDKWTLDCVQALDDVCGVECAVDSSNDNACIACFTDPTMTLDLDGDGRSPATGDCRECDPGVSSGAYDLPGNSVDENCDGTVDNETTTCDTTLVATGNALAHAKAMGLCKEASGNSWGVVSASFVRADGVTACTDAKQMSIMSTFGSGNTPTEGTKMSSFSSGTARSSSSSGYIKPDGAGYDAKTSSTPKYAVPAAAGCNAGQAGYDSCGLKVVVRAPTNAHSFGYNFNFFTSEYPEWLCTSYNDAYVAYYEGSLNTAANKNISFDSKSNPVSVNNGLFSVPGTWPPLKTGSHALLNGTGFDGVCTNDPGGTWTKSSICGGATGWLQTTAPVAPGEDVTLIFNVWDTGDHQWDSTVLLDNFTWSTAAAKVQTGHYTPASDPTVLPPTFTEGWFTRDYDMTNVCATGLVPYWSVWSWNATTPSDSKVEFFVQTATSASELVNAPRDALLFTSTLGPASLAGQPAVARAGSPNTQTGSSTVHDTLLENERAVNNNHLRISARLGPSSDKYQAPSLVSWNLQTSCRAGQ